MVTRAGKLRAVWRNEIRSHIRVDGSPTETTEWLIIPHSLEKIVVEPGDSGAWCLVPTHPEKNEMLVAGMIFAGDRHRGLGYVTPIDVVFEDIQEKTGLCVRLPVCPELQ